MRIARRLPVLLALAGLASCSGGFSEADIKGVKDSIRAEYAKDSRYEVLDVVMVKESATKLTGFVKLRARILGEFTRACSATMAEGGRDSIWRCGT